MTPRDKFRANRVATKGYNDLIFGPQMQAALDAATFEQDLMFGSLMTDVTTAAASRWRKEGADQFRRTLENLNASDVVVSTATPASQLDHKV